VPVDISREHLASEARNLAAAYPDIEVMPVCADFTRPVDLPRPSEPANRNVVYFPGSTIGNFGREEALDLMRVMRDEAGDDGGLLIGVDLVKSRAILEPAYNDAAGVTAEFNLNLLRRLNREHQADFDVAAFRHEAVYDDAHNRIEMRLISLRRQSVSLGGESIDFDAGEYIVTEHSHKYSPARFASLAEQAGFSVTALWTDPAELFSVQYLESGPTA
jgi:dimethylhistidine N-methyltransferase